MKAIVFSGGDLENYPALEKYVRDADLIICADSGVHHAFSMNLLPDILVGDMDSIEPEALRKVKRLNIKIINYPSEKDFTDTQLALEIALERKVTEAIIIGGIGSRPDHSLANIFLMLEYRNKGVEVKLVAARWEIFLIEGKMRIKGKKGDILSLIPLTFEVKGINTKGLYYPLKGESLFLGPARGISNVFLQDEVVVEVKEGILIAVKVLT